jgi:hypothetical protein
MAPFVEQVIGLLRQTQRTLEAVLDDGRHPLAMNNYGPETFSPFDVVGHRFMVSGRIGCRGCG